MSRVRSSLIIVPTRVVSGYRRPPQRTLRAEGALLGHGVLVIRAEHYGLRGGCWLGIGDIGCWLPGFDGAHLFRLTIREQERAVFVKRGRVDVGVMQPPLVSACGSQAASHHSQRLVEVRRGKRASVADLVGEILARHQRARHSGKLILRDAHRAEHHGDHLVAVGGYHQADGQAYVTHRPKQIIVFDCAQGLPRRAG